MLLYVQYKHNLLKSKFISICLHLLHTCIRLKMLGKITNLRR